MPNFKRFFGPRYQAGNIRAQYQKIYNVSKKYRRPKKKAINMVKTFPRINKIPTGPIMPNGGMTVVQPYFETVSSTSGTSTNNAYVWTANGCYDPNVTSAILGHQPMGFDQMMLWYEHYTVTGCTVQVNITNTSAVGCYVALMVSPDIAQVSDIETLNENGNIVKHWIGPSTLSNHNCKLTLSVDIAKINGKRSIIGDDLFRGDAASNPTEQTYLHVCCYNPISATQATINIEFRADYRVKYTEPRKMVKS